MTLTREEILKRHREYNASHREERRLYRLAHREEIREYMRMYTKTHPGIMRQERQRHLLKHPERATEYQRIYRKTHPEKYRPKDREKFLSYMRKYHIDHIKEERAYHRWHDATYPELATARRVRRRARKLGAGGSHTAKEWKMLKEKYGNRCLACGRADVGLTHDHIVPLIKGGRNDISNIQPLCRSCNGKKGTKVIDYRSDREGEL